MHLRLAMRPGLRPRVVKPMVGRIDERALRFCGKPRFQRVLPLNCLTAWNVTVRFPPKAVSVGQRRTLLSSLPSLLVPPTVFIGLLLALWTYKCFMTVVFQDKIIYMPYMPPFARKEKIEDYAKTCAGTEWKEVNIRSLDGVKISLCVGEGVESSGSTVNSSSSYPEGGIGRHVVICYFQGNGSSLPPRLPILSNVLRAINKVGDARDLDTRITLVGLSYRGYWTSSGRASQSGIELDAQATLKWVQDTYGNSSPTSDVEVVLWGQSIGAGVACNAAMRHLSTTKGQLSANNDTIPNEPPTISGLILETPFMSIKRMLLVLYPQKWLPYRYLHPLLWNHWDNEKALRKVAEVQQDRQPRILIVAATRDEVVPANQADEIEKLCRDLGLDVERRDVIGALHTEASVRTEGVIAISEFVKGVSGRAR